MTAIPPSYLTDDRGTTKRAVNPEFDEASLSLSGFA
jgi:hypothetical protein